MARHLTVPGAASSDIDGDDRHVSSIKVRAK